MILYCACRDRQWTIIGQRSACPDEHGRRPQLHYPSPISLIVLGPLLHTLLDVFPFSCEISARALPSQAILLTARHSSKLPPNQSPPFNGRWTSPPPPVPFSLHCCISHNIPEPFLSAQPSIPSGEFNIYSAASDAKYWI